VAVSAREIGDQFRMPLPLLMNILKDLARARLVRSTRGAGGGYVLAIDPRLITLAEVVTAVEGPMRFTVCSSGDLPILGQDSCQVSGGPGGGGSGGCPIEGPIRRLHARLGEFFTQVTLADLLEDDGRQVTATIEAGSSH
jgi:Rrf2 family protein